MAKAGYKTQNRFKLSPGVDPCASEDAGPSMVTVNAAAETDHELLAVLSDPGASESEWLSACRKLDDYKRAAESQIIQNQKQCRRILAIASAMLLFSGLGAAACFQLGLFNHEPKAALAPVPSDVDFAPYMANLQREIKSHWHPPRSNESHHIQMLFTVARNGEISHVGFNRLSRQSEADAAALKSIVETMRSAPPLPAGAPESVNVEFSFDYDVSDKD